MEQIIGDFKKEIMKTNTLILMLILLAIIHHLKGDKLARIKASLCDKVNYQSLVEYEVVPREQPEDEIITNIASTKYI